MWEITNHDHVEDAGAHEGLGALKVDCLDPVARNHLKHINVDVTID